MSAVPDADLFARRESTVRTHTEREIARDWDAVIATFAHPAAERVGPQAKRAASETRAKSPGSVAWQLVS
jgi:hypothetical protein